MYNKRMSMDLETLLLLKNTRARYEKYEIYSVPACSYVREKFVHPISLCCNAVTEQGKYSRVCSNCLNKYRESNLSECCGVNKGQLLDRKFCTKCGMEDDEPVMRNVTYPPKEKELPTRVKSYEKLFNTISSDPIVGLKLMLHFHHNFEEKTGKKDLAKKLKLKKKKLEKEIMETKAWKPKLTKEEKMMLSEEEKEVLKKEKAVERKKNFEELSEEDQKISKIRCPLLKNVLYYILNKLGYDDLKSKIKLPKKPKVKMQDSLLEIQNYMDYKLKTAQSANTPQNKVNVQQKTQTTKQIVKETTKKPKTIIDEESEDETESEGGVDFDDFEGCGDYVDESENPEKYFDDNDLITGSDSDSD